MIAVTPSDAASVLIVSDGGGRAPIVDEILRGAGVAVAHAAPGAPIDNVPRIADTRLVLWLADRVDQQLIGRVGELRARLANRNVPVLVLAGHDIPAELREAFYALGLVDVVVRGAPPAEYRAKIETYLAVQLPTGGRAGPTGSVGELAPVSQSEHAERFRLLMEAASDYAIFFTDPAGVICEWPVGAENLFGYQAAEVLGRPASLIFTSEDRAAGVPEQELAEGRRTGLALDERWHVRKNGERFYATGRLIALRDGGLRGFAKILRDATAAKQADIQLREALARFESLSDSMAQMAWMAEPGGARFWFNRRWFEYTGTTLENAKGWGFASIYHPTEKDAVLAQIRAASATGQAWEGQWRIRDHQGNYRWFLTQVAPVRGADGQVMRWFGTNTDIDRQVRLQELLQASEQTFREIFETAHEGIWLLDADARIEIVNTRMGELLGYSVAELIGNRKTDFVFPEDLPYVQGLFAERRRGESASVEVRFRHKHGGEVWTLLSARPLIRDGKFAGALDMFTDISTRKNATRLFEEELKAQVAQRTRALEEKSRQLESFAYTIAHDLRSPLRAISGYAEFTLEDFRAQLPAEAITNLDRIRASAARLDGLIHDLLSLTRVSHVEYVEEDVAVAASVQWALDQLKAEIQARSAQIEVPANLPSVRGERSILDQVFLNLLSNAIKFVAPGVTPRIRVQAEPHGERVRISVHDNGVGVPPEHHERIFRVFERLQGPVRVEGTGVGLAIVDRAAQRLGGTAGVASEPGRGSTFWIELRKGTL